MKLVWFWLLIVIVNAGGVGVIQAKTIAVGPSESIQAAIDAADPGDVVEVGSGTYVENVNVDKQLILFGVDAGGGRPVVDAGGKGSAITLSAPGTVLEGFIVTNSGDNPNADAGIRVASDRNVIRNNIAEGNGGCGILFETSGNNTVTHNEIGGNLLGIGLVNSSNNTLFLNVFKDNGDDAASSNSSNRWTSSDPVTYRYKGRTNTLRLGNHWSDYSGPDIDDDGIGDVPHVFGAERDDAPLIMAGLRPEIMVDKVANVTSGEPGAVVKFEIVVSNVGEIEFDHVVVLDMLPDGLEYLKDNRSGTVAGGNVTWDLGSLTVGESKSVELLARISGTNLGNITNHAKAVGILSTEYSLTDEDAEALEALIEMVILTKEAEFSREVVFVVPPPSALSGTATGNTLSIVPFGSGGSGDKTIKNAIKESDPGDVIELYGWDNNSDNKYYSGIVTVDKRLTLRGVDIGYGLPILRPNSVNNNYFGTPMTLSANGCVIEGLTLEKSDVSGAGIIIKSNGNVIRENIFINNSGYGILLVSSNSNIITGNIIQENDKGAINITFSDGNLIYFNNFIDNGISNAVSNSDNTWNSPQKITYRYNGITFSNYLGNNWSDYQGSDADGDGIGDVPYNIPGGSEKDKYPLMSPIDEYELNYGDSSVSKVADRETAKPGEEITYTIRVCNNISLVSLDVVVEDIFDRPIELVSVSPAPDKDGLWRFGNVAFGECREIVLVVKTPNRQGFKFRMESDIAGEGFVNVDDDYSSALPSYILKNCVTAVFYLNNFTMGSYSDCAGVLIDDPGTELSTREHGSGSYESDETIDLMTENRSIEMKKDVSANHSSTTLSLYRNRTVTYSSRWTEEARAKNRATRTSIHESYRYATSIDRESRMKLDQNESVMEIESEFDGMGHIGFLKLSDPDADPQDLPAFESREDYAGSFRVLERIDEYGSGVSSDRSASGTGFVAVDKRVGESQRSYESGTGFYESDEEIRTYTNYVGKDLSLVYSPIQTDDLSINRTMRWKEGIWSRVRNESLIGEEYTSVTRLDGETVARGLNEMETEANFSGTARYRMVLKDDVDLDEVYAGDYSIERRVLFEGISKYNRPHLNLTKTGVIGQEMVIEDMAERRITVAEYTITLENDGDRALGPVYIKDLFPPGSAYISSSLRPYELTSGSAEWVLTHLAIGDRAEILLRLDVTDLDGGDLVNRAEASGGYDGEWVNATNFSSIERGRLWCCPANGVSAAMTGRLDANDPKLVVYNLTIRNEADTPRVVAITDHLPDGMRLVDSLIPFSSYDDGVVTWNLIDLDPFETETISYEAEALWSGTFASRAEIEVGFVDVASLAEPLSVEALVTVEDFDGEIKAPGWRPPDWGLNSTAHHPDLKCQNIFWQTSCYVCDQ